MTAQLHRTPPARVYSDPELWVREREGVFGKGWSFLGAEVEAPSPGDWLATEVAGKPVLALRREDGGFSGFHNVCRHRAGPLVSGRSGNCGRELTCRYHGWRYALDGRLRSAVDFGAAEGFDPRDYPLFPVRVESWRGLLFVSLNLQAPPLSDLVAPVEARFSAFGPVVGGAVLRRSHELRCNWKTYVENYLEGYHVPAVHPALAADMDMGSYQVWVEGEASFQQVTPKGGATDANAGLWAWLWPNLGLNVYRTGMMIEHMQPIGVDRTRLDYLYLYDAAEGLESVLETSDRLTAEDIAVVEAVQRNLDAGAYDTGVLSPKHEGAVAWFQQKVAAAVA